MPICFDYLVIGYVFFTSTKSETDWIDPIRKGQVILVAMGLYAGTVAEVLETDVANDHERAYVVGQGWAFGAIAAICYALITAIERNHNDHWDVKYGIFVSLGLLAGAMRTTSGWAKRRSEEK